MAYTRGSSPRIPEGGVAHMDDGELLDKEGKPLPTTGHHVAQAPKPPPEPDPQPEPEPPPPAAAERERDSQGRYTRLSPAAFNQAAQAAPVAATGPSPPPASTTAHQQADPAAARWRCDHTTMARDATGWELAQLIGHFLGRAFVLDLPDDEVRRLPADVARHFRRIT